MPADPIPITVIGGYLGAGKTTVLNALLARAGGRRIGVVVNDFGALGVDAGLLGSQAGDSPVINLANGCVCCTLGDDLGTTLHTLAEVAPRLDHIVVEASGVADPLTVAAWGTVSPFAPGGVVVAAAADSVRRSARDRYVGKEVRRQLSGADVILVTKIDTVSQEALGALRTWIGSITDAPIAESAMGDVEPDVVLGPALDRPPLVEGAAVAHDAEHTTSDYVRWSWVPVDVVEESRLDQFLQQLPAGLLRLKGVVSVDVATGGEQRLVQVVGRTFTTGVAPSAAPLGLEAIGVAGVLDVEELDVAALHYLQH